MCALGDFGLVVIDSRQSKVLASLYTHAHTHTRMHKHTLENKRIESDREHLLSDSTKRPFAEVTFGQREEPCGYLSRGRGNSKCIGLWERLGMFYN